MVITVRNDQTHHQPNISVCRGLVQSYKSLRLDKWGCCSTICLGNTAGDHPNSGSRSRSCRSHSPRWISLPEAPSG
jgi:hypothetical protein